MTERVSREESLEEHNARIDVRNEGVELAAAWVEEVEHAPEMAQRVRMLKLGHITEEMLRWGAEVVATPNEAEVLRPKLNDSEAHEEAGS